MPPPRTPPDERVALELWRVSKRFVAGVPGCCAEVRALDTVSWRVRAGEVAVVEGGMGAGKTTLLLCAAGLLRVDGGAVRARRGNVSDPVRYVARLPAALGEERVRGGFPTTIEALRRGVRATRTLDEMDEICGLSGRIREAHAVGAAQGVPSSRIAYAVTSRPSVLLLDLGDADPGAMGRLLGGVVEQLRVDGATVILATRQARELGLDATSVLTLRCGRVERARHAASPRRRAPVLRCRKKPLGDGRR